MTDPQRIACFFATSGHSGVDRAAEHLLPALARRGYRVDLLKVRRHGPVLTHCAPGLRVVDLGVSHTYAALPALVRYLRRYRPAALLADKDRVNRTALLARALARPARPRLVLSSGTTISVDLASRGWLERQVQRLSMGWLYRLAEQVIVPSHGAAADLAAYTGLPRQRIRVVPRPVVPAALFGAPPPVPAHPWFHDGGPPLLLAVGALVPRKGFDTLLRAFSQVHAARPCRLMILGEGPQRGPLLALAQRLGISADLALPGFTDAVYAHMAHADLFVMTSRWEGLGFVLIEALAVGTPVVATDCPSGPAEILQGGRYGPLVPVDDDRALAMAIGATLTKPLPAAVLREAARPYEIDTATDAYLAALGLPARASNS